MHNVEFDDLEVFLDNVARYDRFRSREHIARTVKYNLMQRVDGIYVSKVDHRRAAGGPTTLADPRRGEGRHHADPAGPGRRVRGAARRRGRAVRRRAAQRRMVTVPNVGHNVHGGNTPGFLEAITPFLASLD